MSNNPKRRLQRHALNQAGWKGTKATHRRRRGVSRERAAVDVATVFGIFKAREAVQR